MISHYFTKTTGINHDSLYNTQINYTPNSRIIKQEYNAIKANSKSLIQTNRSSNTSEHI
jgi:hypothetical protein